MAILTPKTLKISILSLAIFMSFSSSFAQESSQLISKDNKELHEYTLDNGLKLIIKEDHRAPAVINMVWYKIGSMDEPRGLGGISHMLEHMMFKGTKTTKPNEHSTKIANVGGKDNAFTADDFTAYFEQLPVKDLKLAFSLEADRMQNLNLRESDFASERLVVAEERKLRTDNVAQSKFIETFNTAIWTTSPYRNPTIGWPEEIAAWKLQDLQDWYTHFYAPNNATVVVVGDVKPEEVLNLANETFAKVPKREVLKHPIAFEIPQLGKKEIDVKLPAQLPLLALAYKVPSLKSSLSTNEINAKSSEKTQNTPSNTAVIEQTKEVYALMLLENILGGGDSARLPKNLQRIQKIAASIDVDYNPSSRLATTFSFYGVPQDNYTLGDLEKSIAAEIQNIIDQPVSKEELDRALARTSAALVYQQDSMFYAAMEIGLSQTVDIPYQTSSELLAQLEKITPEDIQAVAKKYLQENNLTLGRLHPQKTGNFMPSPAFDNTQMIR